MSRPGYEPAPAPVPVSVIGSMFMREFPLELIVTRKSSGDLLITDVNRRILLKVKPCNGTCHEQRLLYDHNNRPILRLREKKMTAHNRWNAFKGDSMIFTIKQKNIIESNTNLHVFLANNCTDACDFVITGSWLNRNCGICTVGNSSRMIAEMDTVQTSENERLDQFKVTVHQNVDYAFVIAVFATVEAMKSACISDGVVSFTRSTLSAVLVIEEIGKFISQLYELYESID